MKIIIDFTQIQRVRQAQVRWIEQNVLYYLDHRLSFTFRIFSFSREKFVHRSWQMRKLASNRIKPVRRRLHVAFAYFLFKGSE